MSLENSLLENFQQPVALAVLQPQTHLYIFINLKALTAYIKFYEFIFQQPINFIYVNRM